MQQRHNLFGFRTDRFERPRRGDVSRIGCGTLDRSTLGVTAKNVDPGLESLGYRLEEMVPKTPAMENGTPARGPGASDMRRFEILADDDIVRARSAARDFAAELGFSMLDKTRVATAVSELARNTLLHGGGGHMEMERKTYIGNVGIRCLFRDRGPGIADVALALTDGFSTSAAPGHGLPGAKRLTDDLKIDSAVGEGTRVEMIKWK